VLRIPFHQNNAMRARQSSAQEPQLAKWDDSGRRSSAEANLVVGGVLIRKRFKQGADGKRVPGVRRKCHLLLFQQRAIGEHFVKNCPDVGAAVSPAAWRNSPPCGGPRPS